MREDLTMEAAMAAGESAAGAASWGYAAMAGHTYYERPKRRAQPQHTDRITVGQPTPSATVAARATLNTFEPGDRVVHATFGEGEILSIKPMGADKLIEVMFDAVGTKKLMGTYAKLRTLDA